MRSTHLCHECLQVLPITAGQQLRWWGQPGHLLQQCTELDRIEPCAAPCSISHQLQVLPAALLQELGGQHPGSVLGWVVGARLLLLQCAETLPWALPQAGLLLLLLLKLLLLLLLLVVAQQRAL